MNRSDGDPAENTSPPAQLPAQLTVRLDALAANFREALRRASPAAVAPVVKADAYSLGMVPVTRALAGAGADTFFVARLEEGIALRAALPRARLFVLDGVAPGTAPALAAHRLTPVLNALDEVNEWSALARGAKTRLAAALHVDTGMNRSGLSQAELVQLALNRAALLQGIDVALMMSHLACADEPAHRLNRQQLERFRAALAMLPPATASLAASAGIELGKEYLFDIVRPGIGLYGGNPVPGKPNPYRMVASLTGRVLQVRRVDKGESVGYGAHFSASRPSILLTVALGYADGLMRASAKGKAALSGQRVDFAGRISMDLLSLDATGLPAGLLTRGAEVEFFGDTISLEEVASSAGTVNHEVLTSIHPRAQRVYIEAPR